MFERFTDKARRVIVLAQDEALALGHPFIRPQHLALGLTRSEGLAAQALAEFGVTYEGTLERVVAAEPAAEARPAGVRLPFTPEAKKTLELSLREALALKHRYIGTEHILLGALRQDDRLAADLFRADGELLRTRVTQLATGSKAEQRTWSPALHAALGRAQGDAGDGALTTGLLVAAIATDRESQGAHVLERAGASSADVAAALREVPVEGTSDALGPPRWLEIRVGGRSSTVQDAELAALLADFNPEQLRQFLRRGLPAQGDDNAATG
jgi:ATP-dependent Clp protease ATP-binding subunit ClpA